MHLFAAVIPPEPARAALAELVRSVPGDPGELDVEPPAAMHIPVTSFGFVTKADAPHLTESLRWAAAEWRAPELWFSGGTALEWPGDRSVWATLAGDVDGLTGIARSVPAVVHRLGFLVDRRTYRPWLSVGSITDTTTGPYLESVVAALNGFTGEPWCLDTLSLCRKVRTGSHGESTVEVVEEFPLDTATPQVGRRVAGQ